MIGYHLYGDGPHKVLVLHGWFGDSSAFDLVRPFLDTDKFTYAFMDYRGYGQSAHLGGAHTMPEIAQDALDLADSLGWETFSLIGHSMGGMAIQWLAAQAPKRVQRLVGIAPVPASGFPMDEGTRALFDGAKDNPQNRQAILMHTTGNRLSPAFGRVMTERSLAQTTADAFGDYLIAWADTVFDERVNGLDIPFQVLVGEHDPAVTPELVRATILKWFPAGSMEVIPNAGHYPMVETPVALISLWEAFLAAKTPVFSD